MTTTIIDISSWQHPSGAGIDWGKVKGAGVAGVIVKATQSTNYLNPYFHDDVAKAAEAGLLVGAYHYAQPGGPAADEQAAYFHENVAGIDCRLGWWLDLEETDGLPFNEVANWAGAWVTALNTPQTPTGVYVDISFYDNLFGFFQNRKLWLAAPDGQATPQGASPTLVQVGKAAIAGISGQVDVDHWLNPRALNLPAAPATAPPPAAAATPWEGLPVVEQGATSDDVKWVQNRLNAWGFSVAVDGDYGPLTAQAVRDAQDAAGVAVDGIVGPATYKALSGQKPAPRANPEPQGGQPELAQGATGDAVRTLQTQLGVHGHPVAIDGSFGPATKAAVVAFQGANGLATDGVVGPLTWGKLDQ